MSIVNACHLVKSRILLFDMESFNSSPCDKILNQLKLKAFAEDKINVTQESKLVLGRVENIVGKGENAGYQHFLLFPTMFSKCLFPRIVRSWDCVVNN